MYGPSSSSLKSRTRDPKAIAQLVHQLSSNAPAATEVNWTDSGVTDVDVAKLAAGLAANTVCQSLELGLNPAITSASMQGLRVAVEQSGVTGVLLRRTRASEQDLAAMVKICARNASRRLRENDAKISEVPIFGQLARAINKGRMTRIHRQIRHFELHTAMVHSQT